MSHLCTYVSTVLHIVHNAASFMGFTFFRFSEMKIRPTTAPSSFLPRLHRPTAKLEKRGRNHLLIRNLFNHGLWTPREEIAFTARLKIQSQIFRYGRSIFCLPHRPNFSDISDLCLHWVSVVRDRSHQATGT